MRSTTQQSDLRARARAGLLAAFAGLAAGACFNPPAAAVMFACDPAGSSACPAGYTCRDDGCCHKDGTDDPADDGACKLGGGGGADTDPTGGSTGSTGSTGATSSGTTTGATDTGGTSTDTGSSSSSTGPQTTGTT